MRTVPLPSDCALACGVGGWAAELTVRRFVDLGRTKSMMCHPLPR